MIHRFGTARNGGYTREVTSPANYSVPRLAVVQNGEGRLQAAYPLGNFDRNRVNGSPSRRHIKGSSNTAYFFGFGAIRARNICIVRIVRSKKRNVGSYGT